MWQTQVVSCAVWRRGEGGWRGEVAQIMYTHVSKCQKNKKKENEVQRKISFL
jgi:hypothetical protein